MKAFSGKWHVLVLLLSFVLLEPASPAFAVADLPLFGPERMVRQKGAPTVYRGSFDRCEASDQAVLRVWNGDSNQSRITAAEIFVNGTEVASEDLFKKKTEYLEIPVAVKIQNDFRVVLKSGDFKVPAFLRIGFLGRNCDVSPPAVRESHPRDGALLQTARPMISSEFSDEEPGASGVDYDSIKLLIDGEDLTGSAVIGPSNLTFSPESDLFEGDHGISLSVADRAGNASESSWTFTTDTIAPVIAIDSHQDDVWVNTPRITLAGAWSDERAEAPAVTINGEPADVLAGRFSLPVSLVEGANSFDVSAADPAGNISIARRTINLDTVPPIVAVAFPADNLWVNTLDVPVSGSLNEEFARVEINEQPAAVKGNSFSSAAVALEQEGPNSIELVATDRAGNQATATITVNRDTIAPVATVTSHLAGDWLNTPVITLAGTISEADTEVTINDAVARVAGTTFSLSAVALVEGINPLTVTAVDRAGNSGNADLNLHLDTVPPTVAIDAPPSGFLTNRSVADLVGHADEPILSAQINGAVAILGVDNRFSASKLPLETEGGNLLTATVTDRAGNSGSATINIERDSTPPAAPVLTPAASPSNAAVIAVSGSCEAGATVTITLRQPDGAISTLPILISADTDGDGDGEFSLNDIPLSDEGGYLFRAVAIDIAGNNSPAATAEVVRDVTAPVISITDPLDDSISEELEIDITGTVDDPEALLTIDGAPVVLNATGEFSFRKTLQYGENGIILLAVDAAGNSGTAGLTVHADSTPPVVTITSPADGMITAAGEVTVSGSVNEPITALSINGQSAVFDQQTFSIVATLAEGENLLTLSAADRAGNIGAADLTLIRDSQPPTLTLTVPEQGPAGGNIQIALHAGDTGGFSLIEIATSGAPLWSESPTDAVRDKSLTYTLALDSLLGSVLTFSARAVDAAGNVATETGRLTVVAGAARPGYLQGEVFNDHSGLQLGDALVTVTSEGKTVATALTGADGGYFVELPVGHYEVHLSAEGFTSVDRFVTIDSGRNSQVLDARLTPLTRERMTVDLVGGTWTFNPTPDEAKGVAATLTVPPDAILDAVDLSLSPVSNQGLAAPLPSGWAPLGVFELRQYLPATDQEVGPEPFALSLELELVWQDEWFLPAGSAAALVRYDTENRRWLSAGSAILAATGKTLSGGLPVLGQYAFIIPDDVNAALPAIGTEPAVLGTASDVTVLTAAGRVVPSAAPPSIDLWGVGEVVLTRPENIPDAPVSGTLVLGRVSERFDLFDGNVALPTEYTQDLFLYRRPCLTNPGAGAVSTVTGSAQTPELRATFPVTPSRRYSIVELLMGKVGIAVYGADSGSGSGLMVGSEGARIVDEDGNVLEIPAGGLERTVPISTRTANGSDASVGEGFSLLRVVAVDLTRQTLGIPATLTIPTPEDFDRTRPVVIALPVEIGSAVRLQLVALGRIAGGSIASDGAVPGLNLPGIVSSGHYYVLQADGPLGYLSGSVGAPAGQSYPLALVSTGASGLAAVTGASGGYRIAVAVGNHLITALDPALDDSGSAAVSVTAGSLTHQDIVIHPRPPEIVRTLPEKDQGGVDPNASVIVTFSEGVKKETVTGGGLTLHDSAGNAVDGAFSFGPDQSVVTFYPATALKSESGYRLSLSNVIRDLQGYPLSDPQQIRFFIRDVTPPVPPAAGAISATFPDENGEVTVTATQGSAENDVSVLIINNESGAIVGVSPDPDGSFSARISGQLGDEIQVVLMDEAGNQTTISYLTFKAPDGRHLVTRKGGKVEGEGGSLLEIPEGALAGPAVIKMTQVAEEDLPRPAPDQFRILGSFRIDNGGIPFAREVDLSMPVPVDYPENAFPMVVEPITYVNLDGSEEKLFRIVDYATVENGRITTASHPYDGVRDGGTYTFMIPDPRGDFGGAVSVSGITYHDKNGVSGYQPGEDTPIEGASVRGSGAADLVAFSRENGLYATFGWTQATMARGVTIIAEHPLTANRVSIPLYWNDAPYVKNNLNIKLADKDTEFPDTTPPDLQFLIRVAPTAEGRYDLGFIQTGTPLDLEITAIDLEMKDVTLSGLFEASDGTRRTIKAVVKETDVVNFARENRENGGDSEVIARKYTYNVIFENDFRDMDGYFNSPDAGRYTFEVTATDAKDQRTLRRREVQVLEKGEMPGVQPGPPSVLEVRPDDGAYGVPVTGAVQVYFNEPVLNVTPETLQLIDLDSSENPKPIVPAYVFTGIENGRMRATLQPKSKFFYGRSYQVVATTGITDTAEGNPKDQNGDPVVLNLKEERRTTFRTKAPEFYDLADDNRFDNGQQVAFYRFGAWTFAVVALGSDGWKVLDVTDPKSPRSIGGRNLTNSNVDWEVRDVAIDPETSILVLTENIRYADGIHFGYLRMFNLQNIIRAETDPKASESEKFNAYMPIGKARLASNYSGYPNRLLLHRGYAYVCNTMVGIQVVDLKKAQKNLPEGQTALVGVFSTWDAGYHLPLNIATGRGNQLLLTTSSGHLLILDVTMPQIPRELSATLLGGGILDVATAVDFRYIDEQGEVAYKDIAVVTCRDGTIRILDLSNPFSPVEMGIALDEQGRPLTLIARDITLSPGVGSAIVSTFKSLEILDIRDPFHPKRLLTLTRFPRGDDRFVAFGSLNAVEIINGWLYLCSTNQGLHIVNLDGVTITSDPPYIFLDGQGRPKRTDSDGQIIDASAIGYAIAPQDARLGKVELVIHREGETDIVKGDVSKTGFFNITLDENGVPIDYSTSGQKYAEIIIDRNTPAEIVGPKIPIVRPVLVPDYNRDRKIDDTDRALAAQGRTFYFWINDDDDLGEVEGSDIPGKKVNDKFFGSDDDELDHENGYIDGMRDLTDFFPVHFDLTEIARILPPDKYTYRLTTGGEHLNFVYTDLQADGAGNYLTGVPGSADLSPAAKLVMDGEGKRINNINTLKTAGAGLFTSSGGEEFKTWSLAQAEGSDRNKAKGVILFEGRKPFNGVLVLEISDKVNEPIRLALDLSLDGVEQMFRHKNIIQAALPELNPQPPEHLTEWGEPDRLGEPLNCPDGTCLSGDGSDLVFVHGYNVNGQQARGWQAEMFKRFFWSGLKSRFWGLTWYGSKTQLGTISLNYHTNVRNALHSAPALRKFLNTSLEGPISIAAHSLGNMLVSSCLADQNENSPLIADVRNFFMINAAVALEAYIGGEIPTSFSEDNPMVHPDWYGYKVSLGASEWYSLFEGNYLDGMPDARGTLTWRNRFQNLPSGINYFNFYSSGEEILDVHYGDPGIFDAAMEGDGRYIWSLQEKMKGRMPVGVVLSSRYGGWGFNWNDYAERINENTIDEEIRIWLPNRANEVGEDELTTSPFFSKGMSFGTLFEIPGPGNGEILSHRDKWLAEAFPALTGAAGGPMGGTLVPIFLPENVLDMQIHYQNGWPKARLDKGDKRWKHSDLKNISYLHIYEIFQKMMNSVETTQ